MNRTLTIVATILVLSGVGAGVYFMFFTKTASVTVATTGGSSLPVAGQGTQGTPTKGTSGPNTATGAAATISARLVQISTGPVVPGEVAVDISAKDASSTPDVAVSYIERKSGNVYSYLVTAKTLTRINNKTIPSIQSATWLPDGSTAFVRYLSGSDFSTINTYALSATSSDGFFLPQNLSGVAVSSTSVLTLSSGVNGSAVSLGRTDGSHSATIFTTPLSSLHASFAGKNQYLVYSKPSATLSGAAFLVGANGRFSRIAGPLNGLVALASPSGKQVLVSYTQNNALQMQIVNTINGSILPLPVATIADKCVWTTDDTTIYCGIPVSPSTSALYPDDWYQGAVSFNDRIWKIQVSDRYAQLLLDFGVAKKGVLDATALTLNPLQTELVFINKNDGSLWSYGL